MCNNEIYSLREQPFAFVPIIVVKSLLTVEKRITNEFIIDLEIQRWNQEIMPKERFIYKLMVCVVWLAKSYLHQWSISSESGRIWVLHFLDSWWNLKKRGKDMEPFRLCECDKSNGSPSFRSSHIGPTTIRDDRKIYFFRSKSAALSKFKSVFIGSIIANSFSFAHGSLTPSSIQMSVQSIQFCFYPDSIRLPGAFLSFTIVKNDL